MGTRAIRLLLAALATVGVGCAARAPQGPHVWQLRGAVISAQGTTLEVRHKSGRIVTLVLDEQTQYIRNDSPVSSDSLHPDSRVRVEIESSASGQRARRVHVSGGGTR